MEGACFIRRGHAAPRRGSAAGPLRMRDTARRPSPARRRRRPTPAAACACGPLAAAWSRRSSLPACFGLDPPQCSSPPPLPPPSHGFAGALRDALVRSRCGSTRRWCCGQRTAAPTPSTQVSPPPDGHRPRTQRAAARPSGPAQGPKGPGRNRQADRRRTRRACLDPTDAVN